MESPKHRIVLLVVTVLLLFVSGFELYVIAKNKHWLPQTSVSQLPIVPEDWQTYTNLSQRITFKYPPWLYYQDDSSYGGAIEGSTFAFYKNGAQADPTNGDHPGNEVFVLGFYDASSEIENTFKNSNQKVQGRPVLKSESYIQILDGSKIIHIGYKEEGRQYIDQVLSTFKFTEPAST